MVEFYTVGRHTLDDIPDDERRWELVDGVLTLSPSPMWGHTRVASRLGRVLDNAVTDAHWVALDGGVSPERFNYRIPDVMVVRPGDHDDHAVLTPEALELAVEVVSPSSATTDRITKPAQYAAWGIGAYWRVETDPLSLTAYVLRPGDDVYTEIGAWGIGQTVEVDAPFPVRFDLDTLLS